MNTIIFLHDTNLLSPTLSLISIGFTISLFILTIYNTCLNVDIHDRLFYLYENDIIGEYFKDKPLLGPDSDDDVIV